MDIFGNIVPTLFFILILLFCSFVPLITTTSNPKKSKSIIDKVCNKNVTKITGEDFCKATVGGSTYEKNAAANVFRLAYLSASANENVTRSLINNNTRRDQGKKKAVLQACLNYYKKAVIAMGAALDDMDLDTYCHLKRFSVKAQRKVTACQNDCKNTKPPLLNKENNKLVKLTEICKSVANLFNGTCAD